MRAFEVRHDDPRPLARAAAVRSELEQDPATRAQARAMTIAARLRAGFELCRLASQVRRGRP